MVTVAGDIAAVNKSVCSATDKWEKIGSGLGLSPTTLEQIGTDNHGDPAKCLYATIYKWLRGMDKASERGITWRALIRTLKTAEVGEVDVAERLMAEKGKEKQSVIASD